ncbi:NUDIX domain-containing protein [bacterium]|nr:NUDIX domain-containing protein [bacterium]
MNPAEVYHASVTDADLLPVVDDSDVVIDVRPRREVHARKLKHRAVHMVVWNRRGEILLQKRSMKKDSHPGWWDISMGGHVDPGETYDEAAAREVGEELGLRDVPFAEVARRPPAATSGWEFVRIYSCQCEGPFKPKRDEIDELRWVPLSDILGNRPSQWQVTGSGLESIRLWAAATEGNRWRS